MCTDYAQKTKIEDKEISVCNGDQIGNSSKSTIQKTNVSAVNSAGPVTTTDAEGTRPTYADVLSGRARSVNSQETHVPMSGKESVLKLAEHIFSTLSNKYSNSLNHDASAQSTSNVEACKHLTDRCKEIDTRCNTHETHLEERKKQSKAHQKPKQQKDKVLSDIDIVGSKRHQNSLSH